MNKIKADAIVGFKHKKNGQREMFGKSRVFYKTAEKLHGIVDYNVIGYMEPVYNIPLKNLVHDFVVYPRMVRNSIRKDTDIIHVFSQEEAYLLKFLKENDVPKVLSCLDIISLIFPPEITARSTKLLKSANLIKSDTVRLMKHFENADRIITISNNTKNDLIQYLKISPEKIQTIYLGVDETFKIPNQKQKDHVKLKYSLPKSFILYLGSEQPRKNFPFLLKSFYKLKKAYELPNIKLIKVGRSQIGLKQHNEIIKLIRTLNLEKDVIFINHIPDEELNAIYNAATVFVYPSLYEGFGLPPLEAMASGCPVITSNTSSLPEVVGNAGMMVDPCDINSLTQKIYEIVSDHGLASKLRKNGLNQAKLFNWNKTSSETLKIYNDLIS